MASKYLQKFPIPSGFQQILSDFTRQVLRDQPSNIIEYAAKYFQMLEKGKKLQFDSKYNVKKDDKKYQLGYNPKNAQDITKKASNITDKLNSRGQVQQQQHSAPSQKKLSTQTIPAATSNPQPGTQKTLNGEQTSHYVNNLAHKFAESENQQTSQLSQQQQQTNQQKLMQDAVQQTVEILFDKFDQNNTGYLASQEIQRFVYQVTGQMNQQMELDSTQILQFIAQIDKDRDGRISKHQMAKFIKKLLGFNTQE